mgnify:CR=1 FL=1|jgi:hypothetical protein
MVDLFISGSLDRDILAFTVENEIKTIDPFSKGIHFSLEKNRAYRIYFEQKSERYIPHSAEIILNLLCLPIRGVFNIITFNADQNWEKDISAYRVSGYIDVNLNENTEVFFSLKQGKYDKKTNIFYEPSITCSPNIIINQFVIPDAKDIVRNHMNFLQNIASVSVIFFALFIFLLTKSINNKLYGAFMLVLVVIIVFSILVAFLVVHSFKKRKRLLIIFSGQEMNR